MLHLKLSMVDNYSFFTACLKSLCCSCDSVCTSARIVLPKMLLKRVKSIASMDKHFFPLRMIATMEVLFPFFFFCNEIKA